MHESPPGVLDLGVNDLLDLAVFDGGGVELPLYFGELVFGQRAAQQIERGDLHARDNLQRSAAGHLADGGDESTDHGGEGGLEFRDGQHGLPGLFEFELSFGELHLFALEPELALIDVVGIRVVDAAPTDALFFQERKPRGDFLAAIRAVFRTKFAKRLARVGEGAPIDVAGVGEFVPGPGERGGCGCRNFGGAVGSTNAGFGENGLFARGQRFSGVKFADDVCELPRLEPLMVFGRELHATRPPSTWTDGATWAAGLALCRSRNSVGRMSDAPYADDLGIEIHCVYSELRDPRELKPNPLNPNRHSAHQISLLASIIQEGGWRNCITVSKRSGFVVRGHGRLERRIVWQDSRFCFVQKRDKNLGGNSLFRSEDRIAIERRHLKRKWKGHILFESYKSQERVSIDVQRRQPVALV